MAFDSLKRMLGFGGKAHEDEVPQRKIIDSEIDSLERDIQEYIEYTDSRHKEAIGPPPVNAGPDPFAQGGGTTTSQKLRPTPPP